MNIEDGLGKLVEAMDGPVDGHLKGTLLFVPTLVSMSHVSLSLVRSHVEKFVECVHRISFCVLANWHTRFSMGW